MQALLDADADINAVDDENNTALILASSTGKDAVVRFLLDLGADVNIRSNVLGTAIEAARLARDDERERSGYCKYAENIITMLLEAGAL